MARTRSLNGQIAEVSFVGFDDLYRAMNLLDSTSQMRQAVEDAIKPAATLMAREIRKRAPKKSGELKRAIKVSKKANVGRSVVWRSSLNRLAVKMFVGVDANVNRGRRAQSPTITRGKKKGRSAPDRPINSVMARAAVLEFGGVHHRPVGMFRGGYQANKAQALRMMGDNMFNSVMKIAGRTISRRTARIQRMSAGGALR